MDNGLVRAMLKWVASNSRAFMTRLGDIETVFIQTNIARILLYNRYFHGDTII